jgi:hypothetical protein
VVIDVRGNTGGSSSWGARVASALWGEEYVRRITPEAEAVEWRISPDNLRYVRGSLLPLVHRRFPDDLAMQQHFDRVLAGMEAGLARRETMFRLPRPSEAPRSDVASAEMNARVYFLTDAACVSACLDFADVILSIDGVTHVGRSTGADTSYMESRSTRLPSRQGQLTFAMKVYRGRRRGNNEAYQPELVYRGNLDDDGRLERWLRRLSERE